MPKVRTLQINDRLIIMDGVSPLRYVDLTTNKVHVYKKPKKIKYAYTYKITKAKDANV